MSRRTDQLFDAFWREHAAWSQAQFGTDQQRGPLGPLKHLEKEAKEAQRSWEKAGHILGVQHLDHYEELADCFMLVLDAARRSGMTPSVLLQEAFKKLNKNRLRPWPKNDPASNEPVHHESSADAIATMKTIVLDTLASTGLQGPNELVHLADYIVKKLIDPSVRWALAKAGE